MRTHQKHNKDSHTFTAENFEINVEWNAHTRPNAEKKEKWERRRRQREFPSTE